MNKVVKDISSAAKEIWDEEFIGNIMQRFVWSLLIGGLLVLGGPLIQSIFKWVSIGFMVLWLSLAAAGGVIYLWEWISGRRRNFKSEQ